MVMVGTADAASIASGGGGEKMQLLGVEWSKNVMGYVGNRKKPRKKPRKTDRWWDMQEILY